MINKSQRNLVSVLSCLSLSIISILILWTIFKPNFIASQASATATSVAKIRSTNETKSVLQRPDVTPLIFKELHNSDKHSSEKIAFVRALPSNLTSEEYAGLIALLYEPPPANTKESSWHVIQNEIMEVLREERFAWDGYSEAMTGLIGSRESDPVMRDYAVQHLSLYLNDYAEGLSEEIITNNMLSLVSVLQSDRDASESVAGTSLMALCDLNLKNPGLLESFRPVIGHAVCDYVSGKRVATMSNRVAAIQAAGRLGYIDALPAIRSLATSDPSVEIVGKLRSPNTLATFRLSSIAALGYFAEPSDKPFLEELAASKKSVRYAAQSALKNYQ